MLKVYLDNNSSTPLRQEVAETIRSTLPFLIGNPSSVHAFGKEARRFITHARETAAALLQVRPTELLFTSGGTESVNLGIRGIAGQRKGGHIITSSVEHACVISTCQLLETMGFAVTYLSPGEWGAVTPEAVEQAIGPETCLIALMAANNETGVKTEIDAIAALAKMHQIPFFVDGVALLGKEKFTIPAGVSAMAFSGHKIHALQGVGMLFLRSGVKCAPLLVGGEQEFAKRPGTENLLGIVSMGKACEILASGLDEISATMRSRRDCFEQMLLSRLPHAVINGTGPRTTNVSNIAFLGMDGEALLMNLDRAGIAASHGSACSSGALEPSRVLTNMNLPFERVRSSIRFSFSSLTTAEEVEEVVHTLASLHSRGD